jgi:hypothetical protein
MHNGLLVAASTLLSYVLFEAVFYLALCFGLAVPAHPYYTYSAWTNPSFIAADPVIGIRLQPDQSNDGIRVIRGDVQFYYVGVKANVAGFHSDHEYLPKRQRPYRIVVYGSSFVAMLYQAGDWVDHLNDVLAKDGIEVYNFSFDGGALANWQAHYFRELTTTYDFDMVVFVMTPPDMENRFVVSETRPQGYFINSFSRLPRDTDDLNRNYRPTLHRLLGIADPRFLAHLNEHFTHHRFMLLPFDLCALKSVRLALFGNEPAPLPPPVEPDQPKPQDLFDAMLKDIQMRGKQVAIATLPDSVAISTVPRPGIEGLRKMAAERCIPFIDGNALFRQFVKPAQLAGYWPRYEGHWFKQGGDRFAELLAPELLRVQASHKVETDTANAFCHDAVADH